MTDYSDRFASIVERHGRTRGGLLPILHDVQGEFGHVSPDAVRFIADALNLSRADVHGVVSFYHDFRPEPVGKPVVKLCHAEACQARGLAQILPVFEADPGVKMEPVYCLGLCASGPSAMVGDQIQARLDADSAARLLSAVRS